MIDKSMTTGIATRKMSTACPAAVAGDTCNVATYHCARPLATEKTTKAAIEATRRSSMSSLENTPEPARTLYSMTTGISSNHHTQHARPIFLLDFPNGLFYSGFHLQELLPPRAGRSARRLAHSCTRNER